MGDISVQLRQARTDVEGGQYRRALDTMLDAWRTKRAAEVAAAVEALGARFAKFQGAFSARTQKQQLADWLEAAQRGDPAELSRLMQQLVDDWERARPASMAPRVEQLVAVTDDPRLSTVWLPLLRRPTMTGSASNKVWTRIGKVLAASGDPRLPTPLDEIVKSAPKTNLAPSVVEPFQKRLAAAAKELRKRVGDVAPELSPEEDQELMALQEVLSVLPAAVDPGPQKLGSSARSEAEVLQELYADLSNDEPRWIYADLLQERGDPRGEHVALQLQHAAGKGDKKSRSRERALLNQHWRAFLGPLASIIKKDGLVFHRGFLSECCIKDARQLVIEAQLSNPDWRTVRTIRFDGYSGISDQLSSVTVLDGLSTHLIDRLQKHAWSRNLEELHVRTSYLRREELDPLADPERFPVLKTLGVHVFGLHDNVGFWDHPAAQRMHALEISSYFAQRFELLSRGFPREVPRVPVTVREIGWRARVELDDDQRHTRWRLRLENTKYYFGLAQFLKALSPKQVTELEVEQLSKLQTQQRESLVGLLERYRTAHVIAPQLD